MQSDLKYYGISEEDVKQTFLTGDNRKIMLHACGMIEESKRQMEANNHRLAGLNLSIAKLMIEYTLEEKNEQD